MGQFEAAFALVQRAGEGAFFVAEKFAFDEVFGNGGAIDLDERRAGARALAVKRAGDQFLAGAAFALNEDGGLGAGDFADQLAEVLHGRAAAEQRMLALFRVLAKHWLTWSSWMNSSAFRSTTSICSMENGWMR